MSQTVAELLDAALGLPEPERAELAELLRLREGCPATLNYDDGITDDRTHPPYRGKPQMIEAIVGGWHHVVAEMYDMAGEPQADREGAALVSAYNALPGLVAAFGLGVAWRRKR